jgi:hypothetical protein
VLYYIYYFASCRHNLYVDVLHTKSLQHVSAFRSSGIVCLPSTYLPFPYNGHCLHMGIFCVVCHLYYCNAFVLSIIAILTYLDVKYVVMMFLISYNDLIIINKYKIVELVVV